MWVSPESPPKKDWRQHNSGTSKFTSQNRPFVLCYSEQFASKVEAMKREKYLKSGRGREFLNRTIK